MTASYPRRPTPSLASAASDFASLQGQLFARLEAEPVLGSRNAPALDIGPELQGAINQAIREARQAGNGRERLVDRMNLALGADLITKRQLDSWTANSKEQHRFPLEYLAAFCWATGSDAPLRVLASALGYDLVDAREAAAMRLGEMQLEQARLRRESGALLKQLGG